MNLRNKEYQEKSLISLQKFNSEESIDPEDQSQMEEIKKMKKISKNMKYNLKNHWVDNKREEYDRELGLLSAINFCPVKSL